MLRALLLLAYWAVLALPIGLIAIPWTFLRGNVDLLYRWATGLAFSGLRVAGVKVEMVGREKLDPQRTYIFMCNHVSNIDPVVVVPLIPRRTSVLVKKELFRIPLLGYAMRLASLVAVDRRNRDAAIASMRAATDVVRSGLNMTIFPEGTRSRDGRLLPFKKGPFHLAFDAGVPVVPMTIAGTHAIWPKGRFAVRPGTAKLIFHDAIDPREFADRDALMLAVGKAVRSGLPEKYRN